MEQVRLSRRWSLSIAELAVCDIDDSGWINSATVTRWLYLRMLYPR